MKKRAAARVRAYLPRRDPPDARPEAAVRLGATMRVRRRTHEGSCGCLTADERLQMLSALLRWRCR